jgi:hypothetical protein
MKAKGFLVLAVTCFLVTGLVVLKETALTDNPSKMYAISGTTTVRGTPTNDVWVQATFEYGGYDDDVSGPTLLGDGFYGVGWYDEHWGDYCVWASITIGDTVFTACADGNRYYREPTTVINLNLLPGPEGCACWPQEGGD